MNESQPVVPLPAFDELRPTLDSGDVLLFGGDSPLCQRIQRLTGCPWSHVALVARPHPDGPLLLWESTLNTDLPDVIAHEMTPGVNLYDLEAWIRHYAGETAIRPLRVERTEAMRAALLAFYHEARGRPFQRNRLEMLRSGYDGPLGENREADLSSFFCSELVAEAYQRMGLLPAEPVSSEYTPKDFSSTRREPLPLLLGATLGPEVCVYPNRRSETSSGCRRRTGNHVDWLFSGFATLLQTGVPTCRASRNSSSLRNRTRRSQTWPGRCASSA